MIARANPSNGLAAALAVALLAITLNFLQPLAHAALMRDGAPATLWSVFCNAAVADPDGFSSVPPKAVEKHECCLGLATAPAIDAPAGFAAWTPTAQAAVPLLPSSRSAAAGIRDGPTSPRGPPIPV